MTSKWTHELEVKKNIRPLNISAPLAMAYPGMADTVMAYIDMAYVVMTYTGMADIVMAYYGHGLCSYGRGVQSVALENNLAERAYVVTAYMLMACIVMAYIVMAYVVM